MTDAPDAHDFDSAKKVFDELKGLSKDRQERVLRWVSETLGFKGVTAPQLPAAAPPHASATSGTSTPHGPSSQPPGTSRDIRSFVSEKSPSSENQFAAVVAYYYRFEAPETHRRNTIGGTDLQEAARLAGRKRLSNPGQTLKNAKALGYLDNPARGEFSINTVGENLVAMTLPDGSESTARKTTPRRSGSRKSSKRRSAKPKKGIK